MLDNRGQMALALKIAHHELDDMMQHQSWSLVESTLLDVLTSMYSLYDHQCKYNRNVLVFAVLTA